MMSPSDLRMLPSQRGGRLLLGLVALVLLGLAAAALLQQITGQLLVRTYDVTVAQIESAGAKVFKINTRRCGVPIGPRHAKAELLENGQPLEHRSSGSAQVAERAGSFAFSSRTAWLSPSDGSDPRSNGRAYQLRLPTMLPWWGFGLMLAMLLAGAWLGGSAWQKAWLGWSSRPEKQSSASPQPSKPLARLWGLDVLRAVAALMVIVGHGHRPEAGTALAAWVGFFGGGGGVGVDIFFVLSGYLISGLLLGEWRRTGSIRVGRFLVRRAFKLYPSLWGLVLLSLLAGAWFQQPSFAIDRVMGEVFFLQNYIGRMWAQTWSLAVEEHFYLLLALFFACLGQGQRPWDASASGLLRRVAIALLIACPLLRLLRVMSLGYDGQGGNYHWTHLRCDGLMFGVLLRWLEVERPDWLTRWFSGRRLALLIASAIAILLPYFLAGSRVSQSLSDFMSYTKGWWSPSLGFSLNGLAAVILVRCSVQWQQQAWLERLTRPLQFIGQHSYSIYLYHLIAGQWIAEPLAEHFPESMAPGWAWAAEAGIYLALACGLGVATGLLIEQPMLRLRERLTRAAE